MAKSQKQLNIGWILLLTVLLGIGLRLYDLSAEGLWPDEAITLLSVKADSVAAVYSEVEHHELSPVLYQILIRGWGQLFGHSVFVLRLFSVLFGTLAIVMMYLFAREIFAGGLLGKRAGLVASFIASLIVSVAMVQVLFSQELRLYAFYNFLVLLALYLFVRLIKRDGAGRGLWLLWLWFTLVHLLLAYTNYLYFLLALLETVFVFVYFSGKRQLVRRFLLSQLIVLLLFLPMLPLLIAQLAKVQASKVVQFAGFGVPAFLSGLGLFLLALPVLFVAACLVLVAVALRKRIVRSRLLMLSASPLHVVIAVFVFIIAYLLLLDYLIRSFFVIRYLSFLAPLLYILLSYAIVRLRKPFGALVLVALLVLSIASLSVYYIVPTKIQWREAADYLVGRSAGTEPVLVFAKAGYVFSFEQYYPRSFTTINLTSRLGPDTVTISKDELQQSLEGIERFWLIAPRMRGRPVAHMGFIEDTYALVEEASFHDVSVAQYEKHEKNGNEE